MNDKEQENQLQVQVKAELKTREKVQMSKDIDQIEIELKDNDPNTNVANENVDNNDGKVDDPNEPDVILTDIKELPTDENLNTDRVVATDRKLMNDLNTANNQDPDLAGHIKNGSEMFPEKDGSGNLARKASRCRVCLIIVRKLILYIGALVSFLNFTADWLYFFKAPFFSLWWWPLLFFLSARLIIGIVLTCIRIKQFQNLKGSDNAEQNITFKMTMLKLLQEFVGMPIIVMFGLYRVLPIKHFQRQIKIGYAIEVCTSLIPVFIICLLNNSENPNELTWLVTTQLTLRIYAIVNFVFEIIVVIQQMVQNTKLRKRNNPDYQEKTMDEKIALYGKRIAYYTVGSILLTMFFIILGLGLIDGRNCAGKGNVLYQGVCTQCSDAKCLDCWQGPNTCSACEDGYHADKLTGKCHSCSKDHENDGCKICNIPNLQGEAQCLVCSDGYQMDSKTKKCVKCEDSTGVRNCGKCQETDCTGCLAKYYFQQVEVYQTCTKCSDTLEFCDECTDDGKCVKCQENIAAFDSNGNCRECTAPWQHLESEWPVYCQCPYIVDVVDNYACKTCDQLIPGCKQCDYAEEKGHFALGKKVGWDQWFSGESSDYMGPNVLNEPQWIVCTEADNIKAVNVVINQTHQELINVEKGDLEAVQEVVSAAMVLPQPIEIVRQCDAVIDKCAECSLDETEVHCKKCQSGYYIDEDIGQNLLYAVSTRNMCKTCNEFSDHCQECNKYNGCTLCDPTFTTFDNKKQCFKCMYDWECN